MKTQWLAIASALTLLPLAAQANVIPGNWTQLISYGNYGVLRPGSIWAPAPTVAGMSTLVNNAFVPEGQQWNVDTLWWDQDPAANGTYPEPMGVRIMLNGSYTLNRFVVQADDNDSYQLDYWDGSAWQSAFSVGFSAGGPGMRTRDSGVLATAITTDPLLISATGGDDYYSVSEIQAFAAPVPEPHGLALAALGLGLTVAARRRRA